MRQRQGGLATGRPNGPKREPVAPLFLGVALLAIALAAGSGRLAASDPPHWLGAVQTTNCTSQCHTLHQAAGGQLSPYAQNAALCASCHDSGALPILEGKKAAPNLGRGIHHAFGVPAVNAGYDTQTPLGDTPTSYQMSLRVMGGNIVCSTCHNQHDASSAMGGTPRISTASKVAAGAGGGTGTITSGGTFSGANGVWYLVAITVAGDQATARLGYSKDNGTSWFPADCTPGGTISGCLTAGTDVALDDGVTVTFGVGSYALNERWEFYGAWPFLRAKLDSGGNSSADKFCRDCHRSWVMDHTSIDTYDGNYKSHPVGVRLDAVGGSASNRATPLDGDGSASDANPSNDLKLDGSGNVQCLTCHAVHYADSNTASEDGPP